MSNTADRIAAVQADPADVKRALKSDGEFFIHFFLGDELTVPVPDFHLTIFHKMTDENIELFSCAIPRDHAKTTLAKLTCVWYFLFSRYRFVIYVSNTNPIAKEACEDIINFMKTENFRSLYGDIEFLTENASRGIWKFKIGQKTCILKALGALQQVRGLNIDNQRPQVAIVDDLEEAEAIEEEKNFIKLKKWFYGTFRKALDKFKHKIIQIGNMVANRCILKENLESPYWQSMRYGCLLSNGQPLWPDAWPIPKLKKDFNEYLKAGMIDVWFAEMMNTPIAGGRGLIKADEIKYAPIVEPNMINYGFITVDPAISKEKWAHRAAVVVHGWIDDHWQPVDYHLEKGLDPIKIFEQIIFFATKWNVNVVGIESVQFQAACKPVFEFLCMTRGILNMKFHNLYYVGQKSQRLSTWAGMIRDGSYKLTEGDFSIVEQLLFYDATKKENDDDLIDAASYGPQMIQFHIVEIQEGLGVLQASETQDSYAVEKVHG